MLAYGKDQAVHLPPFFAVKKRLKEHHQKISTELKVSENQQKDSYLSVWNWWVELWNEVIEVEMELTANPP